MKSFIWPAHALIGWEHDSPRGSWGQDGVFRTAADLRQFSVKLPELGRANGAAEKGNHLDPINQSLLARNWCKKSVHFPWCCGTGWLFSLTDSVRRLGCLRDLYWGCVSVET